MVPDHWSNDAMVSMDRCGLFRSEAILKKAVCYLECMFDIPFVVNSMYIEFSHPFMSQNQTFRELTCKAIGIPPSARYYHHHQLKISKDSLYLEPGRHSYGVSQLSFYSLGVESQLSN